MVRLLDVSTNHPTVRFLDGLTGVEFSFVIPAQAGIYIIIYLDARFPACRQARRGHDNLLCYFERV